MRYLTHVFALAAVSFLAGCGGPATLDGTTPVTGTVTYNGQGVEGAIVTFTPTGEGRASSGNTDASGKFDLTTLTAGDGVLPGSYTVTITKTETAGGLAGEEAQKYFEEHGQAPPPPTRKELLPEKYKDAATSGLTAEVSAEGENNFAFELKD